MKKILFFTIVSLFLLSCEPRSDYHYFIINNCEEPINASFVGRRHPNKEQIIMINTNTQRLILSYATIDDHIEEELIGTAFRHLTIIRGIDTLYVNYSDKNIWTMEKISRDEANFYLTINPSDFKSE